MTYLLLADLVVTGSLIVMLFAIGRYCYRKRFLTRVGFQVAALMHLALLASIVLRIVEDATRTPRPGHIFAVLSRLGLVLVFAGMVLPRKAKGHDDQKTETTEESIHDTPPVGTQLPRYIVASSIPQEAQL